MIDTDIYSDWNISIVGEMKFIHKQSKQFCKVCNTLQFFITNIDLLQALLFRQFQFLSLTDLNIQYFPTFIPITLAKGHLDFSILFCATTTRSPTLKYFGEMFIFIFCLILEGIPESISPKRFLWWFALLSISDGCLCLFWLLLVYFDSKNIDSLEND